MDLNFHSFVGNGRTAKFLVGFFIFSFVSSMTLQPFVLSAVAVVSPSFPSTWNTPSQCSIDPSGDKSPDQLDIFGTTTYPAVGFQTDADFMYFRTRVDGDPIGPPGNFSQHSWVVLFQTTTPEYQYLGSLNGKDEMVQLWENTSPGGSVDFSPLLNDPAEDLVWEEPTSTHARITTGIAGDGEKYVEWAIPLSELNSRGININTTKYFASSADANNFNKDHLNCYEAIADLSITKTDSPDPVDTNGTLTYTLTVTNSGPDTASNVVITDTLPSGFNLVSVTPGAGVTCSDTTAPTIQCEMVSLSLSSATVTMVGTVTSGTTLTNNASVISATLDNDLSDNNASAITTVNALPTFDLTANKTGTGTGTVTSDISGVSCGSDCGETYNENTVVILTAVADSGSMFTGWSGVCSGTGTCSVTMDATKNVVANFDLIPPVFYMLTAVITSGNGIVTADSGNINCALVDCDDDYLEGTTVELTATPDSGWLFNNWSGACSGSGACFILMDAAKSVAALFSLIPPNEYLLTAEIDGTGTGTVTSDLGSVNCPDNDCSDTYEENTVIVLTAVEDLGATFTGWSGDCDVISGDTCEITMSEAKTVIATFTLNPILGCMDDSATNYNPNATQDDDSCIYAPVTYILTADVIGNGTVTSNVGSINCESVDCEDIYDEDTVVTLTANAGSGWSFLNWTGDCTGTTNPCLVTMSNARSVLAVFTENPPACQEDCNEPETFTLTITTNGNGNGVVTGSGINCDSNFVSTEGRPTNDCTETYDNGTVVNLVVTSDEGSNFDSSWSTTSGNAGTCLTNTTPCQTTMTTNTTLNAHWSLNSTPPTGCQSNCGGGGGGGSGHPAWPQDPITPSAPAPSIAPAVLGITTLPATSAPVATNALLSFFVAMIATGAMMLMIGYGMVPKKLEDYLN